MQKLAMRFALASFAVLAAHASVVSAHETEPDVSPETMARVQAECRQMPYSVLATIRKVTKARGLLTVDLHGNNPQIFLKKGSKLVRLWVPAERGETKVCVPVPQPGLYAVSVFQDRDVNFKFNKGPFGIPAEPYGVSQDPHMGMGPPDFEDSAFDVNGPLTPTTVTIRGK